MWFQKTSITPSQRVIGNSKGKDGLTWQSFLKESMKLNWNFQGVGVKTKQKQKKCPWQGFEAFQIREEFRAKKRGNWLADLMN